MHYSFLNSQYNNDVNNDWVSGSCMDEIKKRLGYRFVLQSGTYTTYAQAGQTMSIQIQIQNKGYAVPFNPRDVHLFLIDTSTGIEWTAQLPDDPRFWLAGDSIYQLNHTLCLPMQMAMGSYAMFLHLPDPKASSADDARYAIRLANTWSDGTYVWIDSS